jgi:hypothetical protein
MSDKRCSSLRPEGMWEVSDPELGTLRGESAQCRHCGGHFPLQPGSGKIRGWCWTCNGPICGPGCAECIPTELLLENIEKGRPLSYKPQSVLVPRQLNLTGALE